MMVGSPWKEELDQKDHLGRRKVTATMRTAGVAGGRETLLMTIMMIIIIIMMTMMRYVK